MCLFFGDGLARVHKKVVKTPEKKSGKKIQKTEVVKRLPRLSAASALATLLEVMNGSDKDHVRVSAAKIILARIAALEEQKMRKPKLTDKTTEPERQAALDAIAQLLDELAAAKVAGHAGAVAVDQGGAARTTDSGG